MRTDCNLYVKSCSQCNRQKKASVRARAALGSFHAGAPMERLHLDILGPFPDRRKGNKYVLMVVCQFTKWMEAYPLARQTADEISRLVVDNIISRFGPPEIIHTDQGRNFTSALFQGVCELLEITKTRTTPYRPCSNGQVERYNRTLLQMICCYLADNKEWDKDLSLLTSAIRSVPNRQTGFSPNMMMLGRELRHPVELLFPVQPSEDIQPSDFIGNLRERLRKVHTLVRKALHGTQLRQKNYYDFGYHTVQRSPGQSKVSKCQTSYEVGDIVLRRNDYTKKGHSSKLKSVWIGPLLITEVITPVLFRVRSKKKLSVLHHDLLKRCHDTKKFLCG